MRRVDFFANIRSPVYAVFPVASICILVAMRIGRDFISRVDLSIAQRVKNLYDYGLLSPPAFIDFCNSNYEVLIVVPLLLPLIYALFIFLAGKSRSARPILRYALYQFSCFAGFAALNTVLNLTLKYALNRPRPSQTIDLAKSFEECQVEFVGFLFANSAKSTCSAGFYSCPSGHSSYTSSCMAGACLMWAYFMSHLRHFVSPGAKSAVTGYCSAVVMALLVVLAAIFMGGVCAARIIAIRHYFGDVTFAVVQVWMFGFLWQVFCPDFAWVLESKDACAEDSQLLDSQAQA